ncbi:MAG: hypothetical protein RR048_02640, partial [Oscillospiraceae bacterium]
MTNSTEENIKTVGNNQRYKSQKVDESRTGSDGKPLVLEKNIKTRATTSAVIMAIVIACCLGLTVSLYFITKFAIGNNVTMVDARNISQEIMENMDEMVLSARYYVSTGNSEYKNKYNEVVSTIQKDDSNARLDELGFSEQSKTNINQMIGLCPSLMEMSESAFRALESGDAEGAKNIVFGGEISQLKTKIETLGQQVIKTESDKGLAISARYGVMQNTAMVLLALFVISAFCLELRSYRQIRNHVIVPLALLTS